MNVESEISKKINDLIREFVEHPQDAIHTKELQKKVAESNLLPLVFNWHPCCITPNGEIFLLKWDNLADQKLETNQRTINGILNQGIKKYPELKELMPIRSANDIDCPSCNGTGIDPIAKELNLIDNIICWCGGLGWIPKDLK
ncbi:hypothetical protein BH20ACI4_BH20ACI4_24210 [soil metagenome]